LRQETEARVKAAVAEIDAKVEAARQRTRRSRDGAPELEVVAAEAAQQMVEQLTGIKVKGKMQWAVEAELQ
jgi:hypothetical protein